MKVKFLFLFILLVGFSALTYAQSESATPSEKKDVSGAIVKPDQSKTGDCKGHQVKGANESCVWVDANMDGKCDKCGRTEKECNEASKSTPVTTTPKRGCASTCEHARDCGKLPNK
jgi:hypothetical protein